jgi:N-acetylneuraminate synthase
MVDRTRELELALGTGLKQVEENECDTVVVQRRAVRAARDLGAGETITPECIEVLRPCPHDAIPADAISRCHGQKLRHALPKGEILRWTDFD